MSGNKSTFGSTGSIFWPYPFYKMFAYKHTETIESVKKYYHFRVLLLHELEKKIFKSAFVYFQKELF